MEGLLKYVKVKRVKTLLFNKKPRDMFFDGYSKYSFILWGRQLYPIHKYFTVRFLFTGDPREHKHVPGGQAGGRSPRQGE